MKVLLLHSISSTHQAYGKGEHDLPPAFAKKLCDSGLAKPLEAFVEEKKRVEKTCYRAVRQRGITRTGDSSTCTN